MAVYVRIRCLANSVCRGCECKAAQVMTQHGVSSKEPSPAHPCWAAGLGGALGYGASRRPCLGKYPGS
jgi:hypothetical protein